MVIRFSLTILLIIASYAAWFGDAAHAADPVLNQCKVKLEGEAKLAAEEPGVLVNLAVKQGAFVRAGDLIANIDDRQARLQMAAAKAGWDAADARYKSEIEVIYARAAADVAHAEFERMNKANVSVSSAVTFSELEKARLQWKTTELQIEKAIHDRALALFDVGSKKAEYDLAELGIERRKIKAPFDGVVVDLLRHENEWLNPGDPVAHFVRLDKMRVETFIDQSAYDPQEIINCEVSVEVELAHNRKATFPGRVAFVSPLLDNAGRYLVRAEVTNRQEDGQWVLRPNHQPKMTIRLGTGKTNPTESGRRGNP